MSIAASPLLRVLARINAAIKSHFVGTLLAVVGASVLFPGLGRSLTELDFFAIPGTAWQFDFGNLSLCLMMISASVHCRIDDFRQLAKAPRAALLGLGLFYIGAPLVAAVVGVGAAALVGPEHGLEIQIGIMLTATMPVAMTSSIWTRHAHGNVPMLLAMITLTTAIGVAAIPVYLGLLPGTGGRSFLVPTDNIVEQLVVSVTAPLLLGLWLRRSVPQAIDRWAPAFSLLGTLGLWGAVSSNVAVSAPRVAAEIDLVMLMAAITVALNVLFYWMAIGLARPFGILRGDAIALLFAGGMRSNGTALVLGMKSFPTMPLVTLPSSIYILSQHLIAAYITRRLLRADSMLLAGVAAAGQPALDAYLELQLKAPLRRQPGASLLLLQLRNANEAGSRVLEEMVRQARRQVRTTDFVCVLLPATVAVVLPDTNPEHAGSVAERIIESVSGPEYAVVVDYGISNSFDAQAVSAAHLFEAALRAVVPMRRLRRVAADGA